jgi:hypothetical protein
VDGRCFDDAGQTFCTTPEARAQLEESAEVAERSRNYAIATGLVFAGAVVVALTARERVVLRPVATASTVGFTIQAKF